jgi:hypothetical protein
MVFWPAEMREEGIMAGHVDCLLHLHQVTLIFGLIFLDFRAAFQVLADIQHISATY